jgi:hypothetical protein
MSGKLSVELYELEDEDRSDEGSEESRSDDVDNSSLIAPNTEFLENIIKPTEYIIGDNIINNVNDFIKNEINQDADYHRISTEKVKEEAIKKEEKNAQKELDAVKRLIYFAKLYKKTGNRKIYELGYKYSMFYLADFRYITGKNILRSKLLFMEKYAEKKDEYVKDVYNVYYNDNLCESHNFDISNPFIKEYNRLKTMLKEDIKDLDTDYNASDFNKVYVNRDVVSNIKNVDIQKSNISDDESGKYFNECNNRLKDQKYLDDLIDKMISIIFEIYENYPDINYITKLLYSLIFKRQYMNNEAKEKIKDFIIKACQENLYYSSNLRYIYWKLFSSDNPLLHHSKIAEKKTRNIDPELFRKAKHEELTENNIVVVLDKGYNEVKTYLKARIIKIIPHLYNKDKNWYMVEFDQFDVFFTEVVGIELIYKFKDDKHCINFSVVNSERKYKGRIFCNGNYVAAIHPDFKAYYLCRVEDSIIANGRVWYLVEFVNMTSERSFHIIAERRKNITVFYNKKHKIFLPAIKYI